VRVNTTWRKNEVNELTFSGWGQCFKFPLSSSKPAVSLVTEMAFGPEKCLSCANPQRIVSGISNTTRTQTVIHWSSGEKVNKDAFKCFQSFVFWNFAWNKQIRLSTTFVCVHHTGISMEQDSVLYLSSPNVRTLAASHWLVVTCYSTAPPYLTLSFTCVADMPQLHRRRSTVHRALPVTGAKLWNSLHSDRHICSAAAGLQQPAKTLIWLSFSLAQWSLLLP